MAEIKVGSTRPPEDGASLDDVARHALTLSDKRIKQGIRKAKIKDAQQGVRATPRTDDQIDPYMTVNETREHNIITGRTGIFGIDESEMIPGSGDYLSRFEPQPELEARTELPEAPLPPDKGIQTVMRDLVPEDAPAPMQPEELPEASETDFADAYESLTRSRTMAGRSARLRAIADSAREEQEEPLRDQLFFPGFEPGKDENPTKLQTVTDEAEDLYVDENGMVRDRADDEKHRQAAAKKQKKDRKKQPPPKDREKPAAGGAKKTNQSRQKQKQRQKPDAASGGFRERIIRPPVELRHPTDAPKVRAYTRQSGLATLRRLIALAGGFLLTAVLSAVYRALPNGALASYPVVYVLACVIFAIPALVLCFRDFRQGLRDLTKGYFGRDAVTASLFLALFLQLILMFFMQETFPEKIRLMSPALLAAICVTYGLRFMETAGLSDDLTLSIDADKRVVGRPDPDQTKRAKASGLIRPGRQLRTTTNTTFLSGGVFRHANPLKFTKRDNDLRRALLLADALALVLTLIVRRSILEGVTALCACLAVQPLIYELAVTLLLRRAQSKLIPAGASLISVREAQSLAATDIFVLQAEELADERACCVHGIKALGGVKLRQAALYASSMCTASGSPLAHTLNAAVSQDEVEIPAASDVRMLAGLGAQGVVEGHDVLLGTAELLESRDIPIPSDPEIEEEITLDRRVLYMAVDGKAVLVMVVSYYFQRSAVSFLKLLTDHGARVALCGSEPHLDAAYIAKRIRLKKGQIFDLKPDDNAFMLERSAIGQFSCPTAPFFRGDLGGMYALLSHAYRIDRAAYRARLTAFLLTILSTLVVLLIVLTGAATSLGSAIPITLMLLTTALTALIGGAGRR